MRRVEESSEGGSTSLRLIYASGPFGDRSATLLQVSIARWRKKWIPVTTGFVAATLAGPWVVESRTRATLPTSSGLIGPCLEAWRAKRTSVAGRVDTFGLITEGEATARHAAEQVRARTWSPELSAGVYENKRGCDVSGGDIADQVHLRVPGQKRQRGAYERHGGDTEPAR